nr:MAG TPA: hypothetical protein [Caudoviricetes sp.]
MVGVYFALLFWSMFCLKNRQFYPLVSQRPYHNFITL